LASLSTEARVNDAINVELVQTGTVHTSPGSGTDSSVELKLVVGDLSATASVVKWVNRRWAFDQRAVSTTVSSITFATHVHSAVPGTRVCGDVFVEEGVEGVAVSGLRGFGDGEIVGKVFVGSAGTVARAVVGASGTLARGAFVSCKARAQSGGAIANALIGAFSFLGVVAHSTKGRVVHNGNSTGGGDGCPGDTTSASSLGAVSTRPFGAVRQTLPFCFVLG